GAGAVSWPRFHLLGKVVSDLLDQQNVRGSFSAYLQHTRTWCGCLSLSVCLSGTTPLGPRTSGPMPTRRREQVPAAARPQQQQPAQQHQQQEEEMVTTSRRLLRLRGFGCGGSWCKPPVLYPDTTAANSRVSALATDMLERGWVTREEYQQLLHGDRLYSLHESEMEEQERQRRRRLR
ncbi:unnamed protein product, partial [Ectocarpus sp. 8 AP-2014]